MGAAGSIANNTENEENSMSQKLEKSKALLEEFRKAVIKAAMNLPTAGGGCGGGECNSANPGNTQDKQLKSIFDHFDANHDGILDKSELDTLIQRLTFDVSDQLKAELRSNMKNLLLSLGDDSFHVVFNQFADVIKPTVNGNAMCRPIVSREPKRIVFVGATGSGKSSLCTALTGQGKTSSSYKVGNRASSETTECKTGLFTWFGDNNEEEFLCVDTPGLDDELGRDNEHINHIIQEMQKLEYVSAIVMVVNGQNPRFSTSLQNMIQKFEKAFSSKFYEHSIIAMTRWYMDEDSIIEREEDGRTEDKVTEDLNQKINSSSKLLCRRNLPVVFVDCFYQRKDPKNGKQRLAKIKDLVNYNVFRTADLSTVKPRITEILNTQQIIRTQRPMSLLQPILFDDSVQVLEWDVNPSLPVGVRLDPVKGTIAGTPMKTLALTDFQLTARSVGGWSEPFTFSLEVGHNESEVKKLVIQSLKSITVRLEEILPVDPEGEPFGDSEVKGKLEDAKSIGSELFKEKLQEVQNLFGKLFTFKEFVELFRSEYDRLEIILENDFLTSNQRAFDRVREKDKIENDLKLQLLKETTNLIQFKSTLQAAEDIGGVDAELLERGRQWLVDITPSACCHEKHGCPLKLRRKERLIHENFCIYGLPTFTKNDVSNEKGDNGKFGVFLKSKSDADHAANGKYAFDEDDQEYYFINRSKQVLYRIRSEPKGQFNSSAPTDVTWVLTSASNINVPDEIVATSTNQTKDPLFAEFADFLVEAPLSYKWKESKIETHPAKDSLLLMYFGGKWCPYCPPFTRVLAKFYASIVRQCGADAISVVFVSSDSNELEMFEYYMEEHGNWLAIPYEKRELKQALSSQYKITGIPTCVLVNPKMEEVSGSPFLNNEKIRTLLGELPDTEGPNQDAIALQLYERMKAAVLKSMGRSPVPAIIRSSQGTPRSGRPSNSTNIDKSNVDIFCSLRFAEASEQGHEVVMVLKERGLNAVIIDDVENGDDIAEQIADLLDASKLVVIFGSTTYGKGTSATFSTKEELQFIMAEKKPFFLIKMCERFQESRTRFYLPNSISYTAWLPGQSMPEGLIDSIVNKYEKVITDK